MLVFTFLIQTYKSIPLNIEKTVLDYKKGEIEVSKLERHSGPVLLGLLLAILFASQLGSALIAHADVALILTVSTNKSVYARAETVTVQGTLRLGTEPVGDGVVGIQVNKPNGDLLLARANTTGSAGGTWSVEILQAYPSDSAGNPKSSFLRGTLAWFTIVVRNNLDVDKPLTLVLTLFYSSMVPYKVKVPVQLSIGPGNQTFYVSDPIPTNAVPGQYIVFANAFSELPAFTGYAYCPEKSATFNITSTTSLALASGIEGQTVETASVVGSYSLGFRLSTSAMLGNYSVYAGSYYKGQQPQGQQDNAASAFQVKLVGDINQDNKVDGKDIAIAAKAFGTRPGEQYWDPRADINLDDRVDGKDIAIISKNFGQVG